MKKLPCVSHLTNEEYKLLLTTYAKHNSSMGKEERKKHLLSDIIEVKRNVEERCLEVYYRNGEWFHYTFDGSWY